MEIQAQILNFLVSIRNDFLTTFFMSITILAEKTFLIVILSVLYWCVNKEKGKRLAWFVLFGSASNGLVKNIVRMPRPYEVGVGKPLRVETATSYSFPSGHTQSVTSFWTGSMLILKTKASVILGSVMIILTALSRLYLGVHWPMDVLGAIGFGVIFVYFANQMMDEKGTFHKWHVLGSSILCLVLLILPVDEDFYNAGAALWGLCLGVFLEQQYVKFEVSSELKINLKRLGVGLLGVVLIYIGISKGLPHLKGVSMIKNALVILWVALGAPYIFAKWLK